jgi:hypothetical protein
LNQAVVPSLEWLVQTEDDLGMMTSNLSDTSVVSGIYLESTKGNAGVGKDFHGIFRVAVFLTSVVIRDV